MIAVDEEEGGLICGLVGAIVEGDLCGVEEGDPVILVEIDVVSEVDFNFLVGAFGLAVGFLVEGGAVLHVDLECLTEFLSEVVEKCRPAVGDD